MSSPRDLAGKSFEEVAEYMGGVTPGSLNDQKAEFMLRQTEFQKDAAEAAKQTALYTRRYTRYMFWSVVILALSAVANLVISGLAYMKH